MAINSVKKKVSQIQHWVSCKKCGKNGNKKL